MLKFWYEKNFFLHFIDEKKFLMILTDKKRYCHYVNAKMPVMVSFVEAKSIMLTTKDENKSYKRYWKERKNKV